AALCEADGDFIALVGESCVPDEGWWQHYEDAFERTDSDVLYGPPSRHGPSPDNCAFRGTLLDGQLCRPGWLEQEVLPRLARDGRCADVPVAGMEVMKESILVRSYAQMAEDVRLNRAFRGQATGFYIDIGAGHPAIDSV